MALTVDHLRRTADTLQTAVVQLRAVQDPQEPLYELFRLAAIKSFELSLEMSVKLLRKALKAYEIRPREVDRLVFKDVFREAGRRGLMDEAAIERWFAYRENRNTTAHDYGEGFARQTLAILPAYVQDVRALASRLEEVFDAST